MMRTSIRLRHWLTITILAFCLLILGGFFFANNFIDSMMNFSIVQTQDNDSGISYTIYTGSSGATTSKVHKLYIHKSNAEPKEDDLISVVDKAESVEAVWVSTNTLRFCVGSGRVFRFQNFKPIKIDGGFQYVSIDLREDNSCSTTTRSGAT